MRTLLNLAAVELQQELIFKTSGEVCEHFSHEVVKQPPIGINVPNQSQLCVVHRKSIVIYTHGKQRA